MAFDNFFSPNIKSLSTGRWSWFYRCVTDAFGPYGYPEVEALIGLACIVWAFYKFPSSTN
jgi:hypothetical protein